MFTLVSHGMYSTTIINASDYEGYIVLEILASHRTFKSLVFIFCMLFMFHPGRELADAGPQLTLVCVIVIFCAAPILQNGRINTILGLTHCIYS